MVLITMDFIYTQILVVTRLIGLVCIIKFKTKLKKKKPSSLVSFLCYTYMNMVDSSSFDFHFSYRSISLLICRYKYRTSVYCYVTTSSYSKSGNVETGRDRRLRQGPVPDHSTTGLLLGYVMVEGFDILLFSLLLLTVSNVCTTV